MRRRGSPNLQVVRPPGASALPDLSPGASTAEAETRAWNALRAGEGDRAAAIMRQAGGGGNAFLRASIALLTGPLEMADDLFEAGPQTGLRIGGDAFRSVHNDTDEDAELLLFSTRDPNAITERTGEDFWSEA